MLCKECERFASENAQLHAENIRLEIENKNLINWLVAYEDKLISIDDCVEDVLEKDKVANICNFGV